MIPLFVLAIAKEAAQLKPAHGINTPHKPEFFLYIPFFQQ